MTLKLRKIGNTEIQYCICEIEGMEEKGKWESQGIEEIEGMEELRELRN